MARYKDAARTDYIIQNWLRNRNTIEFLGIWEQLNNPDFKPIEFDGFRKQAGLNSFSLTAKRWIETTNAIGLKSKSGRYGVPINWRLAPYRVGNSRCWSVAGVFRLACRWTSGLT